MAEDLQVVRGTKEEMYEALIPQIRSLVDGESDEVANMANVAAAIKEMFGFFWVGFYRVVEDVLVLGPFQGPIACTRIRKGRGVCGTAWEKGETLVVPDVEEFPGHIACSSRSRSEIVLPIWHGNTVWGVLDIDSEELETFDAVDSRYLEQIVGML